MVVRLRSFELRCGDIHADRKLCFILVHVTSIRFAPNSVIPLRAAIDGGITQTGSIEVPSASSPSIFNSEKCKLGIEATMIDGLHHLSPRSNDA